MTSSCSDTIQRIRSLVYEMPPDDWDEVSPESIRLAEFFIAMLEKDICTEDYPWRAPEIYQEPYGGGIVLTWHHNYRRMSVSLDAENTFAFASDQWGIIEEIEYVGVEAMRELWNWFWNPEATWTYIWKPKGK